MMWSTTMPGSSMALDREAGRHRPLLRRPHRAAAARPGPRRGRGGDRRCADQGRAQPAALRVESRLDRAAQAGQPQPGGIAHRRTVPLRLRERALRAESAELYDRWAIPSPGKPLFEAASANFTPQSPAKVNTAQDPRGPLLLTAGGKDHTVPAADHDVDAQAVPQVTGDHRLQGVPGPRPLAGPRPRLARSRRLRAGAGSRSAVALDLRGG